MQFFKDMVFVLWNELVTGTDELIGRNSLKTYPDRR
jgi:hypothetical protein